MDAIWDFLTALSQPWATLFGSVIGGTIVGIGALLGFRASRETRETMENTAAMNHEREVMSARQERYTKSAEQLSSEHETIRLAGVYALAALADEWQYAEDLGQRDVAVKLLCAYLRANPRSSSGRDSIEYKDQEVREAIVFIIVTHMQISETQISDEDAEYPELDSPLWPGELIDLSGANLESMQLSHLGLDGATLRKTILKNADLRSTDFSNADLSAADLEEADLTNVDLTSSLLIKTNLSRAVLAKVQASAAEFQEANLSAAGLREADLSGSSLWRANLSGANLSMSELQYADLRGANLKAADLEGADLTSADLKEADLSEAYLRGANLTGAYMWQANLSGADLAGAKLDGAKLWQANLTGVNFDEVDLSGAIGFSVETTSTE